jgi:hypothetical protein
MSNGRGLSEPGVVRARKIHQELGMSPQNVLAFVKAQPFRPFRIRLASGREFTVRHPEMIYVGQTDIVVFTYTRNDTDNHEKWEAVSLERIESIGFLKPTVV